MIGLPGRRRYERAGFTLYGAAVSAARDPFYYQQLAVPDTLDGRFDLVGLHVFLLIRRLGAPDAGAAGPKLAQAVFDAMFSDMDINLREMGVGDLSVGRKVRSMWEALHGRSAAYQAALAGAEPDLPALAAALARNVWRGAAADTHAMLLARVVVAQDQALAGQPVAGLFAGEARFLAPAGIGLAAA
jgi:cytochrome b pre-mRNA-processing protein 3